jgi:hypothetical protein
VLSICLLAVHTGSTSGKDERCLFLLCILKQFYDLHEIHVCCEHAVIMFMADTYVAPSSNSAIFIPLSSDSLN